MVDSVGQLIFFLLTPISHIGASLFFAKPRFGKWATAAIWLLYVALMMILPPPYVIPVFADEPAERVQISSALSALTLVTMILFAVCTVLYRIF